MESNKKYDEAKFKETINRVMEFLCTKSLYEKRHHNEMNQCQIGGVAYWFAGTKLPDGRLTNMHLCFNAPPQVWDFKKILDDVDVQERILLANYGVNIEPM
jgi:hypothetical protein